MIQPYTVYSTLTTSYCSLLFIKAYVFCNICNVLQFLLCPFFVGCTFAIILFFKNWDLLVDYKITISLK